MAFESLTMEWVIGIAAICGLLGVGLGMLLPYGRGAHAARVAELESALESSQDELAEYRSEVYGQFAQTADKFKKLDESYQDLHRQLATSAVALCGDQATPLLIADGADTLAAVAVAENTDALVDEAVTDFAADTAEPAAPDLVDVAAEPHAPEGAGDLGAANVEEPLDEQVEVSVNETVDQKADEAADAEVAVEIPTITDALLEQELEQKSAESSSAPEKETGELKQSA